MFYTVIDLSDVFRTDLFEQKEIPRKQFFSTVPSDYLRSDGLYI